MKKPLACFLLLLALCALASAGATPELSRGISMHMMPKRAADLGGGKWGFAVTYAEYLKPETAQPVLQTSQEFLSFAHKQDAPVQENGVWMVITHPDAYSEAETALLEEIKSCAEKRKFRCLSAAPLSCLMVGSGTIDR